ncbi:MAG: 2-hydroxyacid dehydrogenase [Candidatus Micrarchaeota archaeon]
MELYNAYISLYAIDKNIEKGLKSKFSKLKFKSYQETINEKNADLKSDAIIVWPNSVVNKKVLDKMPKLKAIFAASTGTNNIDLDECTKRAIIVKNCPTYSSNAVAEMAITLAFSGLRKIEIANRYARELNYAQNKREIFAGGELSGKTCAILGTGNIGALIAKKLICLGCNVLAYSRSENEELVKSGVKYGTLAQILPKTDIVFIALPANRETFHLVNDKVFAIVKKNVGVVNIARGEIIDSRALYEALPNISFAALDVIEDEPIIWIHKRPRKVIEKLAKHDKVLLLPHIGASTIEAQENLKKELIKNIEEFLSM